MGTRKNHPLLRPHRLNTYTAYSIGCAIAWALVWIGVEIADPKKTRDRVLWVFLGWVIGWSSASLARVIYPPPKRRPSVGPRSFFQGFRGSE